MAGSRTKKPHFYGNNFKSNHENITQTNPASFKHSKNKKNKKKKDKNLDKSNLNQQSKAQPRWVKTYDEILQEKEQKTREQSQLNNSKPFQQSPVRGNEVHTISTTPLKIEIPIETKEISTHSPSCKTVEKSKNFDSSHQNNLQAMPEKQPTSTDSTLPSNVLWSIKATCDKSISQLMEEQVNREFDQELAEMEEIDIGTEEFDADCPIMDVLED